MTVSEVFPEVDRIEDDELRAGVVEAWERAMADNDVSDLTELPWFPPGQRELGIPMDEENLVPHVRDVTRGAIALAESLAETRGTDVDRDLVVAGGLVHDVSKLYECHGAEDTEIGDLLGHPYYGVHAVADLPVELAHIVLSHSPRTNVEPAFVEAEIVKRADEVAAAAIKADAVGDLRNA